MRKNEESRIWVQRMLADDCRVDDLSRLLRSLRPRTYGVQAIKDIADLTAHEGNRDQGLMVGTISAFYYSVKLNLMTAEAGDFRALPADYGEILGACFKALSDDETKRRTGRKRRDALSILNDTVAHFNSNADGTIDLSGCSASERDFLRSMAGFAVAPVYTADSLFRDFVGVLVKNRLLRTDEVAQFGLVREKLAIFVLSMLHRLDVSMPDGSVTELVCEFSAQSEGRKLNVLTYSPIQFKVAFRVVARIFQTDLVASDHCAPELLELAVFSNDLPENPATWSQPIEIGRDWKLQPMA